MKIELVEKQEQLPELCERILNSPWVAVDTEFLREKTYYPKFCLLQIATPEWVACVDPIVLDNLEPLLDAIYSPNVIKVFHSCRQDIEIFYNITGKIPLPVFDTQIAAPLLGFQENPGYAMLVSSFLNINLTKTQTRTDWSIRPLTQEQLNYAADDVIYLCKIYQIICQQLEEKGRQDWLALDFQQLAEESHYQLPAEHAWMKFKGKNKVTGRQLSIIQLLTVWREKEAQRINKPKNWLIRDDLILELAKLQPCSIKDLFKIRNMNEKTIKSYGAELCKLIEEGKNTPPIPLNNKSKSEKITPLQDAVVDVMTAVVKVRALENQINPMTLASRKELEKLLLGEETLVMKGWRFHMVGKELTDLLEKQTPLTIDYDRVSL